MREFYLKRKNRVNLLKICGFMIVCGVLGAQDVNANDSQQRNSLENLQVKPTTLNGRVIDKEGRSLPGAIVTLKSGSRGVVSDQGGYFTFDKLTVGTMLVANFDGMKPYEFEFTGQDDIVIIMQEDAQQIDDVVVVAFGEQKKESVIASIESINTKDLKIASSNLTAAFAGKIPGVISYQTSGEPGADNAQFFVRGVTTFGYKASPLILVDGFEASTTDLARIQPDDIESFSVLKDASATALYGARGANGIIMVNTKIGNIGKVKINGRLDVNVSSPTRMNKLVDGVSYMEMYNEAMYTRRNLSSVSEDFYSPQKILGTKEGRFPMLYPNINWYDELFKKQTFNTKANLNVSGGGAVATYYVAGGIDKETGILKVDPLSNFNNNIDINRFHIRSNVLFNLTKTTKLDTRISGRFERFNGPYTSATSIFNMVMNANPVDYPPVWVPDEANRYTNHTLFGTSQGAPSNPYAEMVRGYESRDETTINAQATLMQDLGMLLRGLKIQFKASANVWNYYSAKRKYNPFFYALLDSDPLNGSYTLYQTNPDNPDALLGNVEPGRNSSGHYYFEGRMNWDRQFGKHTVGAMVVGMAEEYVLTAGNSTDIFETLPERNLGVSGRASYDYASRYFLEFNFGYNGSEKFAKKYRFGFFPSFGMGWLVSNEPFYGEGLKNVLSNLKFKFTYGKVGNDAIAGRSGRFFYMSQVEIIIGRGQNWGMDWSKNPTLGYKHTRYANPEVQWEVSTKMNAGLELGFFKGEAVKIQVDYFRDLRDNVYMAWANLPASAGFEAPISGNIGKVKSHGVDGSIDVQHSFSKNFWITARGNFTYATNEYLKLSEPDYPDRYRSKLGQNINQQWGYVAERLFIDEAEILNSPSQSFGTYQPGDIKYRDINNDGKIDTSDQVPIGYPTTPEIQYGFGMSLGFKKFDFSFFFQGNARVSFFISPTSIAPFKDRRNALQIVADGYWQETNPDVHAFWPRLSSTPLENNTQTSTWWLRDGKFLRLKTVELGYNLPQIRKIGLTSSRIYVSGENLFIITPFKMWDPEMGGNGLGYPISRRFNIGLQLSF